MAPGETQRITQESALTDQTIVRTACLISFPLRPPPHGTFVADDVKAPGTNEEQRTADTVTNVTLSPDRLPTVLLNLEISP